MNLFFRKLGCKKKHEQMALSLVFVIVKALTISSMINATFCLHCLARQATVLCVFTLYVTFSCLVIERTRIFVFVFKGQIMCKSIANQTTDWLTCKKQTNQRPCMVSNSITFSIELCFQRTYAYT